MKRFIITLLFLIPLLCGCTNVHGNLTINKNKSANFEVLLGSQKTAHPFELETIKANYNKFLDKDYTITDNSIRNKVSIKASKRVKNILKEDIDLSSLGFEPLNPSGKFVEVKHNFFVTSYNIHMRYLPQEQINRVQTIYRIEQKKDNIDNEYFKK